MSGPDAQVGAAAEGTRGTWRQKLLAVLIALAVGAFVAELAARARFGTPLPERLPLGRIEAHPTRGWRMLPGEDHYTYQHLVEVNSLGLRGPEVPQEKLESERRVLCLGDSMIYGQGVDDGSTLPAHLERTLAEGGASDSTWRVINAGHRAYATNQELALLEELGPALDPDAVVLFWYDNDFEEYDVEATHAELLASGTRVFDLGGPATDGALRSWRLKQLLRRSALIMYLHDLVRDSSQSPKSEEFYVEGFATLRQHLARYRALCEDSGWRPLLAVVPHASTLRGDGPVSARARRVQELASAARIEVVDLLPPLVRLTEELGRLPLLPYDGHYLGVANQRMAAPLADALLQR